MVDGAVGTNSCTPATLVDANETIQNRSGGLDHDMATTEYRGSASRREVKAPADVASRMMPASCVSPGRRVDDLGVEAHRQTGRGRREEAAALNIDHRGREHCVDDGHEGVVRRSASEEGDAVWDCRGASERAAALGM